MSYVVLDCNFEWVILSILNVHVFINRCIFSSIKKNWLTSKRNVRSFIWCFSRWGHTVKLFFQSISWNIVSGAFMKHEILSWNYFTLVSKFHYLRFSSIKKNVFPEERYLLKYNSIKQYLLLIKQKQKFKKTKMYLNETMVEKKKETTKVHVLAYFQNFR